MSGRSLKGLESSVFWIQRMCPKSGIQRHAYTHDRPSVLPSPTPPRPLTSVFSIVPFYQSNPSLFPPTSHKRSPSSSQTYSNPIYPNDSSNSDTMSPRLLNDRNLGNRWRREWNRSLLLLWRRVVRVDRRRCVSGIRNEGRRCGRGGFG